MTAPTNLPSGDAPADHDAAMGIADRANQIRTLGSSDYLTLARAYKDVVRDAERWRAMRPLLIGLDFAWGEPLTSVAVFKLPAGRFGENADLIADAAIAARAATTKEEG